jgi:putative acetyltransferase
MIYRTEHKSDVLAIRTVLEAAFPTPLEADLVDALRKARHLAISIVAEDPQAGIVGYIGFSPVLVPGSNKGLAMAPIGVLPMFQRRFIGTHLIEEGLSAVRSAGFQFVVVVGDLNYYKRFRFKPGHHWSLDDEYENGERFLGLEMEFSGIPKMGGMLRYAPEFSILAGR